MHKLLFALSALLVVAHPTAFAQDDEAEMPLSPEQIMEELADMPVSDEIVDADSTALTNRSQKNFRLVIKVDKSMQTLEIIEDGISTDAWEVSTAAPGYETPVGRYTIDRMEVKWNSRKYDMARMDDAIFFHRGYALHATYGNNIKKLGTIQSHGCVRQSPENADRLFKLAKKYGERNVLIIVQE